MPDELQGRLSATVGERYEILGEIGRGGMGVVYRARDVRLRRSVAIKLLPPELAFREEVRSRFLREAQTAAQLSHPNIVPIYSVDEVDGLVFFVMALVEGESLGAYIKREGRVTVEFARHVLREVADALAYAHGRSIIHRDIKPDNILLDRVTGRTLVSDFGIARAAEGDSRLTVTGIAVGTPAYMSPEQAAGEREIDGRSDLYSLGVVGYQMMAGELPFTASNTPAMLVKHISQPPRPVREVRPDVPPGLERAIDRALAKKPEQRWTDVAAFRDALADDTPPAGRSSTAPAPRGNDARPAPPDARVWPAQPASLHQAVRDAVRGANGSAPPPPPPALPPAWPAREPAYGDGLSQPPIPPWMPPSWRDVRNQWRALPRDQRRLMREQMREMRRAARRGEQVAPLGFQPGQEIPIEYRIREFRRHVARMGTSAAVLAGINAVTSPFAPWFLVPTAFMGISVLRRAGALWAEGVRLRDIFGKDARLPAAGSPAALGGPASIPARQIAAQRAQALAPAEILAGPHGGPIQRAVEDRMAIDDVLAKLAKTDREMIPDVAPTADQLVERVAALAQALHRLDHDVTPETIARIDQRIAAAAAEPETGQITPRSSTVASRSGRSP